MGEAKQRGSFDQRQAIAVERDRKAREQRKANQAEKPIRRVTGLAVLACLASFWPGRPIKREDW